MADIEIEAYQKAVTKMIDDYLKEAVKADQKIGEVISQPAHEFAQKLQKVPVPQHSPESEVSALPKWVADLAQKKGDALKLLFTVVPNVEIDVKARKTKAVGYLIKYNP
jgi:hypothetical protein